MGSGAGRARRPGTPSTGRQPLSKRAPRRLRSSRLGGRAGAAFRMPADSFTRTRNLSPHNRGSKPASQRQLRVGEELRHVLAGLLRPGVLRDPALRDVTVTVTEVQVSPDLRNATAFVMP